MRQNLLRKKISHKIIRSLKTHSNYIDQSIQAWHIQTIVTVRTDELQTTQLRQHML
jgi:hypothetical protein